MNKWKLDIFENILRKLEKAKVSRSFLIGIDGIDGSGKSCFADGMTEYFRKKNLNVIHSSVDYFHNPKDVRYNLFKPSYKSYFEDSFNYPILIEELLEPIKKSTKNYCITKYFNHRSNSLVNSEPINFESNTILVFDGVFNLRDELKDYWDFSIFLQVDFEEAYRRMASRDGCPSNPKDKQNERYYLGQMYYFEKCNPKNRADMVIDNSNFETPKILR